MPRSPTRMLWLLGLPILLLLACAPGLGADEAVSIAPSWQCPTPTPIPTTITGYQPTATLPPAVTALPGTEPTAEPILSTPLPTATPYVRTGSDYFLNQRIQINDFTLMVTQYQSQPGPTPEMAYHRVSVVLDNPTDESIPLLLDLSQLKGLKGSDGRMVQGSWWPDTQAARTLGIVPISDPAIQFQPDGTATGGYPPGTTTRTLVFIAPVGIAQTWGMSFSNRDTPRVDGAGSDQVWVLLRSDPYCTAGPGGGATDGQPVPPAGTPSVGSGRWPVPLDTPITRGYGCHSYFTGTRGPCGGATPWWHDGIDFAKPEGTPLYATRAMTILFAGQDPSTIDCSGIAGSKPPHGGFGNYLKTQDALGYTYWYGHVSRWRVSAGQPVEAGTQIADMGSTGCSTGSHLHFRVRLNGLDRNPMDVISR